MTAADIAALAATDPRAVKGEHVQAWPSGARSPAGSETPGPAARSPLRLGQGGQPPGSGIGRPDQTAALRAALHAAREHLGRAQSHAEDLAAQRDLARAETEWWHQQYQAARASHDLAAARRDALAAALPGALSAMLTNACATAWEEGRQAARGGVALAHNPYRADPEPVPGSPAATTARCRAYLHWRAARRSPGPRPDNDPGSPRR